MNLKKKAIIFTMLITLIGVEFAGCGSIESSDISDDKQQETTISEEVSETSDEATTESTTYSVSDLKDYTFEDLAELNGGSLPDFKTSEGWDNQNGRLINFYGKYSELTVKNVDDAINSFYNVRTLTGIADPATELRSTGLFADENARTYQFQQYYNDILVFGSMFVVTVNHDWKPDYFIADYTPITEGMSTVPTLTMQEACDVVENSHDNVIMYNYIDEENGNLFIYGDENGSHLVWHVFLELTEDTEYLEAKTYDAFVDAHNGDLVHLYRDWIIEN